MVASPPGVRSRFWSLHLWKKSNDLSCGGRLVAQDTVGLSNSETRVRIPSTVPMKITCLADLHGNFNINVPPSDLVIVAGDIGLNLANSDRFYEWHDRLETEKVIYIAGNMDSFIEKYGFPSSASEYLEDSATEFNGYKIWGTPWTPPFVGAWQGAQKQHMQMIPDDTDIIVSHSPPYGYGDMINAVEHKGSKYLLDRMREVKPKLVVCGHIHRGHGVYYTRGTKVVNAAVAHGQKPIMVEVT